MQQLRDGDPRAVGRYSVLARLGAGAGGTVFLARSPGGRLVAVKVIHPHLTRQPEFRRRFEREIQALRAVGGFHTAAVIDAGWSRTTAWLATEYVPAPSLEHLVTTHGPLPVEVVITLVRGIAEALRAIHVAGVVHRDLKPSNVLVTADGPRVIDFGVAGAVGTATLTGSALGTPGFLAPEQATGEFAGPAADLYSLGAVLVYAATGRGPFGEAEPATLLYRVVHAEPDLDAVPDPRLRALAAACLARDPLRRPTPAGVLAALPDLDFQLPPGAAELVASYGRPPDLPAPPARARRWPLVLGAVAGALILVSGTAFALRTGRDGDHGSTTAAPSTSLAAPAPSPARIPLVPALTPKDMAFSADGRQLFVTGSDRATVIDTGTGTIVRTTSVAGADHLVVAPDGARIYAFRYNVDVGVYDAISGTRLAAIPATDATFGLPARDGSRMYIQYGDGLATVDTATNALVGAPIPVRRAPAAGAITPDGTRLYAVEFSLMTDPQNPISVLDLATGTVSATIDVGGRARALALSADGRRAAVINWAEGRLSFIDTTTNTVLRSIEFDQRGADVALSPDGSRAYVSSETVATVLVIDTAAGTVVDRLRVGRAPDKVLLSGDGRRLYVASREENVVTVVPIG
ncbi:protein kinase domain-containing protein [Nocardia barduliensis]|uniref:protein kinase domain-containing protein n=1 Tax=Nocardia barduliensis TaxID=2736643 RepID=UPI001573D1AF|nr:protein kinase [Nocardia barduliensis]